MKTTRTGHTGTIVEISGHEPWVAKSNGDTLTSDNIVMHLPDGRAVAVDILRSEGDGHVFGSVWIHSADDDATITEHINL